MDSKFETYMKAVEKADCAAEVREGGFSWYLLHSAVSDPKFFFFLWSILFDSLIAASLVGQRSADFHRGSAGFASGRR